MLVQYAVTLQQRMLWEDGPQWPSFQSGHRAIILIKYAHQYSDVIQKITNHGSHAVVVVVDRVKRGDCF